MGFKILLIEDNPDHALLTKRILTKANTAYALEITQEAKDGLEKILNADYDVVLSDYRMPGLTALDLLKEMKKAGKNVPIIVVTSAGSEKIAVEIMKAGAYDYIIKDATYEENLPLVIERTMDRYYVQKEKQRLQDELRQSNDELRKMYKMKSEFTSMVSHELRTPLAAIKESIAIVLDGSAGEINDDQQEFLRLAKRNVDRLKRIIDDVLDFSKLESKKLVFKMQSGDVNTVIQEVGSTHQKVAEEKKLYLKCELDPNVPRIKFDSDRIFQVLNNLVSNAIKFTDQGGITLRSTYNDATDMIEVSVTDTGEGIKEEDMPKLFQKFQQLGGANQRKTGGTGLGLAISKEILRNHYGDIWVESKYGEGSVFKFTLPAKKSFTVLVVDDDKEVLSLCAQILAHAGYKVVNASGGRDALKLLEQEEVSIVVLDMKLKDISGYEVVGRIRSNRETAKLPILAMSGYSDEIKKLKAQEEESVLPWIVKPFDANELISRVQALLAG